MVLHQGDLLGIDPKTQRQATSTSAMPAVLPPSTALHVVDAALLGAVRCD
jgi:hypothetical protein